MYAQQTPYQQPVSLVPQIQPDSIDQASKLVDLIEKIGQRQSGANLAPGTGQFSPMNAAQFQPANAQQIAMQEMLLRNPQLLSQSQNSQQQVAEIKSKFDVAVKCANEHYHQLQQLWQVTQQIVNVFNALGQYASELERVAGLASASQGLANAFSQELNAAYDVARLASASQGLANAFNQELNALYSIADIQYAMLNTPQFALMHTSNLIKRHIEGSDDAAMQLISEEYIDVVKNFEGKRYATSGIYSDPYRSFLQDQVSLPPQLQKPQEINSIVAWANGLQSQGFGKQLKRVHTQQLLNR
jgi:hypothetical protein